MSATIKEVRKAIYTALDSIYKLKVYDHFPDQIDKVPACYILPIIGAYGYSMANNVKMKWEITMLVSLSQTFEEAQDELDLYIMPTGDKSIWKTIHDDTSLGGVVSMAAVVNFEDYGFISVANVNYLGCRFNLDILE